jgi:hypothetical protein
VAEHAKTTWWGRYWKWVVAAGVLTFVLLLSGFIALIFTLILGVIKSSVPYRGSLEIVQNHPLARQSLGAPIDADFFVTGSISVSGSSGNADIAYTVSGPKGSGTVYVVGEKAAGQWEFTTLVLEIAETGERVDLLSEIDSRADQTRHSKKNPPGR